MFAHEGPLHQRPVGLLVGRRSRTDDSPTTYRSASLCKDQRGGWRPVICGKIAAAISGDRTAAARGSRTVVPPCGILARCPTLARPMGRLLRSIVAIGVLVVVGDATNVRRDVDGPAETRVHVAEAIVHLEDARLLLREAERLIVSAGSIFFGDPLHIRLPSDAPDTTTSPARHDADPPGFESVFGNFERGLSMCLASYQQSVQVMETLIRRTANATGCVLRNFAWNRGAAALTRRLMSVLRIQRPVGHRPNIFAIRDRTFVHLPARRFWNVTRVSMGDLADAMTISLRQIAATRTMLVQMGADRVIIHELFSQAMILSRRRMLATTDILADARRRLPTLPTMINMAAVDADLAAARANLDLLKVLVVHLALLQERYEDALELVDNARRHVQQSCYLANLPSVFRHRTARAA